MKHSHIMDSNLQDGRLILEAQSKILLKKNYFAYYKTPSEDNKIKQEINSKKGDNALQLL